MAMGLLDVIDERVDEHDEIGRLELQPVEIRAPAPLLVDHVGDDAVDLELFKTQVRYTGASLGYQLSAALGGGLTPLIATALVSWAGGSYWPAPAWLAGLALISLVAALIAPETRTRSSTADVVA
jgi:hypothetical protein